MPKTIPGPKPLPLIGAAYTVDTDRLMDSQIDVARKYGEICAQDFPGQPRVVLIRSQRLVNELCDENRFDKQVHPAVANLREIGGDGLFTSDTVNPNWGKAHRILMPAFGPDALRNMYSDMCDIAEQLVLKWERLNKGTPIDVTSDFTRLTLDTIALCSFSYRFNSFYSESLHPFVQAMVGALIEAGDRSFKPDFVLKAMVRSRKRYDEYGQTLEQICNELIEDRRRDTTPDRKPDILDTMLNAKDPETGERLSNENVRYQLVTFLIAGHETTSGLLSFATYELMNNRDVLERARKEVAEAIGTRFPRYEDLPKLGYVDRILRETLRLHPTAPAFAVTPYETTTIGDNETGDGYEVHPGDTILVLTPELHRDPKVWENPERFDPERFTFDNAKDLAPNAWKPFGNGQRSCIGRGFALQEALLVLTLIIQRFDLEFADSSYHLKVKQTLTLKPEDFQITVTRRRDTKDAQSCDLSHDLSGDSRGEKVRGHAEVSVNVPSKSASKATRIEQGHNTPMQVFFGSNGGTAEGFANRIAERGKESGFYVSLAPLDDAVENLGTEGPVIIVTASYEGLPPDNALGFVSWIDDGSKESFSGLDKLTYGVFGCGNSEWANTFQRIPTLVDSKLSEYGGHRLLERGVGDVRADYLGEFDKWSEKLFASLAEHYNLSVETVTKTDEAAFSIEVLGPSDQAKDSFDEQEQDFLAVPVKESHELSKPSSSLRRHKYHLTLGLPDGCTYSTGDYMEILPRNSREAVEKALGIVGLPWATRIKVNGYDLPFDTDHELIAGDCFAQYFDLNAPVSKKAIVELAERAECPPDIHLLSSLTDDQIYLEKVVEQRLSLLDLASDLHAVFLTIEDLFRFLPPLLPRRYSISSSALAHPSEADLTISRILEPAYSGHGVYRGTCSSYLADSKNGTVLRARVVPGPEGFKLPTSEAPLILIGAGSGMAPLRAFIQELGFKHREGSRVPSATLFYGCTREEQDFLYSDELQEFVKEGILDVRPAFSREIAAVNGRDVKYIQDRIIAEKEDLLTKIKNGAHIYVCGAVNTVVPGVRDALVEVLSSEGNGEEQLDKLQKENRYSVESFS
ncbi:bifunctional cytochrome P450/NADPH--P450 reductase [Corynebacterium parakroppenstedtii]